MLDLLELIFKFELYIKNIYIKSTLETHRKSESELD